MTPILLDMALKAGFSDPIEGWMGEAYEGRLEAFAKLIIEHEAEKQEPVAWCVLEPWLSGKFEAQDCFSDVALDANVGWVPLYTTPQPQREWVGLTDKEIQFIYADSGYNDIEMFARAIEAKLRSKNGY